MNNNTITSNNNKNNKRALSTLITAADITTTSTMPSVTMSMTKKKKAKILEEPLSGGPCLLVDVPPEVLLYCLEFMNAKTLRSFECVSRLARDLTLQYRTTRIIQHFPYLRPVIRDLEQQIAPDQSTTTKPKPNYSCSWFVCARQFYDSVIANAHKNLKRRSRNKYNNNTDYNNIITRPTMPPENLPLIPTKCWACSADINYEKVLRREDFFEDCSECGDRCCSFCACSGDQKIMFSCSCSRRLCGGCAEVCCDAAGCRGCHCGDASCEPIHQCQVCARTLCCEHMDTYAPMCDECELELDAGVDDAVDDEEGVAWGAAYAYYQNFDVQDIYDAL
eukprot:GEZU01029332.1.p1 GENE.GEZU01029332.1~~GEZU01029332.1.p1  ORF type:complete len:335 (-),score=43.52 GEZU01029332.1:123-1127(-)